MNLLVLAVSSFVAGNWRDINKGSFYMQEVDISLAGVCSPLSGIPVKNAPVFLVILFIQGGGSLIDTIGSQSTRKVI